MINDDLFNLVKSLTKSEKRYFKLISNTFKRDAEHIRLFDFLCRHEKWEIGLLEQFEGGFSGNEAALKKRYLKEQLFGALRVYNKEQTVGSGIMTMIQNIEILYHKRLFQQCLKMLKRAKKITKKHERFGLHLELLGWERRLISSTLEKYDTTEKNISKEETIIHKQYQNVVWARQLQSIVFEFKKENGFLKSNQINELNRLVDKSDIENEKNLQSKRASFYFLWAQSIYYWMLSNHEKSYQASLKMSEEHRLVVNPEDYFYGLLEHLTACICTHRYEEVLAGLLTLEKLLEDETFRDYLAIRERFFYYKANYSLIANVILGNKLKLESSIETTLLELNEREEVVSNQIKQVLNSTLGHAFFALNQYEKARELYWSILNISKTKLRKDILDNAKLFYLFILYELKKHGLLESELVSSFKHFNQAKETYMFELSIIKKMINVSDFESSSEKLSLAKEVSLQIKKKIDNKESADHFEDYLLLFWANSILNKSSCLVEASEWYKNH